MIRTIVFVGILGALLLIPSTTVIAQGYQSPSRERVETLLEKLNVCMDVLKDLEQDIAYMESNPGKYTLEQYQDAKTYKKMAEGCIADTRNELDHLRKDYPGWFNSGSATVDLGKGHAISANDLNARWDAIAKKMDKLLNRLNKISKPTQ